MKIRAKFYVRAVEIQSYDPSGCVAKLQAVTRKDGDNADWAKATPSGEMTMSISNPSAALAMRELLGRDVFIDITPADDKTRTDAYTREA